MRPIYNMDVSSQLWLKRFSREQLREIASEHGIKRGRNARDTASNLSHGIGANGEMTRFKMDLFVSVPEIDDKGARNADH